MPGSKISDGAWLTVLMCGVMYVSINIHVHIYKYVCMLWMYIHIYVCIYICIYIHTYVHESWNRASVWMRVLDSSWCLAPNHGPAVWRYICMYVQMHTYKYMYMYVYYVCIGGGG